MKLWLPHLLLCDLAQKLNKLNGNTLGILGARQSARPPNLPLSGRECDLRAYYHEVISALRVQGGLTLQRIHHADASPELLIHPASSSLLKKDMLTTCSCEFLLASRHPKNHLCTHRLPSDGDFRWAQPCSARFARMLLSCFLAYFVHTSCMCAGHYGSLLLSPHSSLPRIGVWQCVAVQLCRHGSVQQGSVTTKVKRDIFSISASHTRMPVVACRTESTSLREKLRSSHASTDLPYHVDTPYESLSIITLNHSASPAEVKKGACL